MNTPGRDFAAGNRSQSAPVRPDKLCLPSAWGGNQKPSAGVNERFWLQMGFEGFPRSYVSALGSRFRTCGPKQTLWVRLETRELFTRELFIGRVPVVPGANVTGEMSRTLAHIWLVGLIKRRRGGS